MSKIWLKASKRFILRLWHWIPGPGQNWVAVNLSHSPTRTIYPTTTDILSFFLALFVVLFSFSVGSLTRLSFSFSDVSPWFNQLRLFFFSFFKAPLFEKLTFFYLIHFTFCFFSVLSVVFCGLNFFFAVPFSSPSFSLFHSCLFIFLLRRFLSSLSFSFCHTRPNNSRGDEARGGG